LEGVIENQGLPNLIIAGVNKSGTTSLFTYLSMHPEVCVSKIKETCHFLPVRYGEELSPLSEYKKYFGHYAGQKYIVESTPGYFYGGSKLAQAIKDSLGCIKIMIVFRDPIERLFSFYKSQKSILELNKDVSFEEYVKKCLSLENDKAALKDYDTYSGVMCGFYSDYINDWFETFGDENIKILFFDYLKSDTRSFLREACQWLDIDANFYDTTQFTVENKSVDYKNKALHKFARGFNKRFERFFRKYPVIKQKVRNTYFKINSRELRETITEEDKTYLADLYEKSKQNLSLKLKEKGYNDLPNWLRMNHY